ncbi:hypothetical protein GOP47_0029731 [Adiantum capillus-veneris]|nr:hypothetical protein GOP47_0029731 [Adiantum capillus-veneris]
MLQAWVAFAQLKSCSYYSSSQKTFLSKLKDTESNFQLLLQAYMKISCWLYGVVSVVQLVLLLTFYLIKFLGKFKKSIYDKPDRATQLIKASCLYKATYSSTIFLSLLHVGAVLWLCYSATKKGWHQFVLVEVAAVLQVCVWCTNSSEIANARAEGRVTYPCLLRLWWIVCFFLTGLTLASRVLHWRRQEELPVEAWADFLAFPSCTFLSVIAVYGKTGLLRPGAEALCEPLLNSFSGSTSKVTNYATANLFSLATFTWLDSLLAVGYKKPLELDEIPQLAQRDTAAFASELFETQWTKLQVKNVVKCLAFCSWKDILLNAFFAGLCTCASYVGPYLINDFVEYLGGRSRFSHEGYILSVVFFVANLIETLAQRQWYFGAQQLGLRTTAALSAVIYRKGLSLSNQMLGNHPSGEIVNIVSVDVNRVSDFTWYLHDVWLLFLQISLALLVLYRNLGLAALAALAATAVTMLANLPLSFILEKFQNNIMESKDARMRATSEVLRSMRILKLQAWETKYRRKIEDLRKEECRWLHWFVYAQAGVVALFWSAPAVIGVITFSACVFIGTPLTAGRVLSALATFRILQDPVYTIPDLIGVFSETKVSVQRIQQFLEEQEIDKKAVLRSVAEDESSMAIEIHDSCFSWDACSIKPTLTVHQLLITRGSKVAVCGQVGSGKSSLISCILGEIPKISGRVQVYGNIAYVAQTAWIQSGKVEDNILFGKPMDRQKYNTVLTACALTKDIELFSHGDQTEIGERGINLSGGQKQRIQLARALYQDADIYLLDDPFSAVDAHTGSHLFQKCILDLLKQKTVLYVTHQVEFLPVADNILVLDGGIINQAGKFNELIQSGAKFSELIGAHLRALKSVENRDCSKASEENLDGMETVFEEGATEIRGSVTEPEDPDVHIDSKGLTQLVQEEEREMGKVRPAVYWSLATAVYGGALVPFLLLAQILFQALQIASNYWMAWATSANLKESSKVSSKVLLGIYLGLAAASALCILARVLLLAFTSLKTAQKFFVNMLHSVFHAPMCFFDATPSSRILNRASTDQSALDLDVCNRFAGLAFNMIQFAGIFVVMSQVAWQIFLLFIPVVGLSLWLQQYYIASARELARLVGIRMSPIIHHFSESISGVATIRGFNQESRFTNTNLDLIDCYCRPLFHNFAAMEWLCLRLNVVSSIMFLLALLLVVSLPLGTFDPSIAGLAVTYGLNVSYLQYMIIWNLCNLENKIISVERIQQYCQLPSEAPYVIDSCRPPTSWPWAGTVILKNLQVKYAPHLPLVLHGITCTFLGGQKIGVVGRTGSGKSTLIQVLFRMVEPVAGSVLIDDLDISQIGLHDLRSKLSIIPQDPTLFEGTIRENLDPLQEHSDAKIWEVLDKSQLGDVVRTKHDKLDAPVSENGENWSVGQRQLVCLGRALLKRTRILVLDEATASVDTATDGIIQDTLRLEFADCTVITIAHRIPTIIQSDRVLFLSDGRVAEYERPQRLLEDKTSLFAKLVSEYARRSSDAALQ